MNSNKVCYVWDENLIQECDRLPAVPGRASMVHSLIAAYGLLQHVKVVRSKPAVDADLKRFHSDLYLNHLKTFTEIDDEYMTTNEDEELGIGYDCPPVSKMTELVSTLAGGTITAARCLTLGLTKTVLNWCGGWHHANRHGAEGFCYVNDIVLGIEYLREKFPKVLYIDLDVHHGNGVQDAYNLSKSVFTLSIHKFEPGFYPGTGDIDDIGNLAGKGYACNMPLHALYSDDTLEYVFGKVFASILHHFLPDAIVVQCGADALALDPHGGACATERGYRKCVSTVLEAGRPTMLLGGGGYNHSNAARLWTSLTALVTGVSLDENIPDHTYWPQYGPDYCVAIQPTLSRDTNKTTYLDECVARIQSNLNTHLQKAKCVSKEASHDKPSENGLVVGQSRRIFEKTSKPQLDAEEKTTDDVYAFTE
ncbi:histone deacetylase 8-like [Cydia strobilella]|uniref:histone deacetylase 8-like n=1 Tax=Cydia strobilella TaxID=1100964 RepID=UPI003007C662